MRDIGAINLSRSYGQVCIETGRSLLPEGYRAHLCSSGAPAPERIKIAWQTCQSFRRSCPIRVMRSDTKTHGEGQGFPPPYGAGVAFFFVARGPVPRDANWLTINNYFLDKKDWL